MKKNWMKRRRKRRKDKIGNKEREERGGERERGREKERSHTLKPINLGLTP